MPDAKAEVVSLYSRLASRYQAPALDGAVDGAPPHIRTLLEWIQPRPGQAILDLACGPGNLTFPLAASVAPNGNVVGVDLSAEMVDRARGLAARTGLPIRFEVMDAECLDFPDGSFAAVTAGYALPFFPDLPKAVAELKRVLAPGGRFAATLPKLHNPGALVGALNQVIADHLPPPESPSLSAMMPATAAIVEQPARLAEVLVDAGFDDVVVGEHVIVEVLASAEEFVEKQTSRLLSMRLRLERLDEANRVRFQVAAADAVRRAAAGGPLRSPNAFGFVRARFS